MNNIESGTMFPTFWANTEKIPGNIMGKYTYVKGKIPQKRFALLFNLYTYRRISYSISEYDDKNACFEECNELDALYKDHEIPEFKHDAKNIKEIWDYNNKSWWGYLVLDFEKCLIIRVGGHGFKLTKTNSYHNIPDIIKKLKNANSMEVRDYFFRDVDKVPDNYKWDYINEYKGWLQFRWGDGTNAIGYVAPPKPKKQKTEIIEDIEEYDEEYDNYEADLIEEKYADLLDKETRKNLMEKYGW